jgi:septum formation protein
MKIILGSSSPRRKYLLEEAGFEVEVSPLNVEEDYPEDLKLNGVALYLAHKKSNAYSHSIPLDSLLLTADSTVVLKDKILGKPETVEEGIHFILELSSKVHQVITGVVIRDSKKMIGFKSTTLVEFSEVTEEEATYYVNKYQPFDKAGGYGLQEWIGLCKVKSIHGTYSNVMGLPVHEVYEKIKTWTYE